ncbi:uncharacterized protein LTR77_005177 [Saxophila tyrrhenica]|uniref:FAD-binding PCMH-type domain-containing protein n=1 Tax=Saxophila tyrrhenica TaxID=1690608 RepID=A0AAV9PFH7_9PEZI|nr:hypothetical protein LTR77_005177 [Saxophila tyrrhenica]
MITFCTLQVQMLALVTLTTALDLPSLNFDWQQPLSYLGLAPNNLTATGCEAACTYLTHHLPIPDIQPDNPREYWKEKSFFWSQQQSTISPSCFVQPLTAEHVSTIVKLAREHQCKFAVKSGGHAAFAGASNVQDGMTIDLQFLDMIEVSEDKQTTRVGPGNRWVDVYKHVVPMGLSVVGGRNSEIGVGGLTLGGGISWYSSRYGWALDGVRNYQVVVADGRVLEVDRESYPDLYWALRGGGNNFGVVTRFDFETFPQGDMWGGSVMTGPDSLDRVLDAFHDFAYTGGDDMDAYSFSAFCWYQEHKMFIASTALVYAQPVENPAIFENYTKLESMHSTLKIRDMVSMSDEIGAQAPNGLRNSYWTATFRITREMLQVILDIFMEELEPVKEVEGMIPALIYQPMSNEVLTRFSRNGGNCLGLEGEEGPLLNINYAVMWKNEADDEAVLTAARNTIRRSKEKAKELGLDHRYLYQNYASHEQDVMASYGEENLERLRSISREFDPEQVFQKLQPGYFKL